MELPKFINQGPKLSEFFKKHFIYRKTLGEGKVSAVVLATDRKARENFAVKVCNYKKK